MLSKIRIILVMLLAVGSLRASLEKRVDLYEGEVLAQVRRFERALEQIPGVYCGDKELSLSTSRPHEVYQACLEVKETFLERLYAQRSLPRDYTGCIREYAEGMLRLIMEMAADISKGQRPS